jgi:hypothetical protein
VAAGNTGGDAETGAFVGARSEQPPATNAPGGARPSVRRAAGIYGTIVTASVLATAGGSLPTFPLAVAVFFTLVVYWLAEEYAELGERASAGRLPTWPHVRLALVAKWPMVTASYIPLVALLVARLLGATTTTSALIGLIVTVSLLMAYGWSAGRSAGLPMLGRIGLTVLAAVLGLLMITLKVAITHLH